MITVVAVRLHVKTLNLRVSVSFIYDSVPFYYRFGISDEVSKYTAQRSGEYFYVEKFKFVT